ncbi:uncharacterized protein UV8b_04760 [Ustilaginoidea virens]|uniref:Small secreted protein n=1 Tax=Ustilaginoidea virens TaxID=1159556 RepID=A0A8E5HSS5_USTVR|nr:uncharacterized protein UV8b_04760 [Ustilaginoidea virens]QUC20519.1 hypothetical protein UV8b_04760 [Ustilaginoidea virens]
MYFAQTIVAALLAATSAVAAPVADGPVNMMATVPRVIFEHVVRNCDAGDNSCTTTFTINPQRFDKQYVSFVNTRNGDTPASRNAGAAQSFGDYTITSGWSGQFGPGNGFTVFSVVDHKHKLITYPSYTDKQLANGQVVTPDQSYAPANLN